MIPAGAAILVEGLSRTFEEPSGRIHALGPVSLEIPRESFVCVLGPTGCGKTTLLRTIAGLELPDQGSLQILPRLDGCIPEIGYVFQQGALFPWMTVRANVEFPLRARRVRREQRAARVDQILEMVELEGFGNSFPHQLSGGMQQRAALARAVVTSPDVLLLDEPFSSLDTRTSQLLQAKLKELWLARNTTVVFVTHNIEEAVFLAGEVIVLGHRPGRIVRRQVIDLPEPRSRLSDGFIEHLMSLRRTFEELVEED
jgi:ABC-type nitrate/sulfonate/bicarbonate transport system ATPase subunit